VPDSPRLTSSIDSAAYLLAQFDRVAGGLASIGWSSQKSTGRSWRLRGGVFLGDRQRAALLRAVFSSVALSSEGIVAFSFGFSRIFRRPLRPPWYALGTAPYKVLRYAPTAHVARLAHVYFVRKGDCFRRARDLDGTASDRRGLAVT
jgi:hypothetical protein